MGNDQLVSVIVPVFNIKDYIADCVESIIRQSYHNLEIILIDDGSTDGSGAICDRIKLRDARITVYHNPNNGLSYARNFGIEKSNGDILSFVDGDDLLHPRAIEVLVNNMISESADISEGGVMYERNIPYKEFVRVKCQDLHRCFHKKQALIEVYASSEYLHGMAWAKIYKKELFDEVRFPVGMLHEDLAIINKIYEKSDNIVGTSLPVYYVRERNGSITRSEYSVFRMDCWLKYFLESLDLYKDKDTDVYHAVCAGYLKNAVAYYSIAYDAQDKQMMKKLNETYRDCFTLKALGFLGKKTRLICTAFRIMPNVAIRLLQFRQKGKN